MDALEITWERPVGASEQAAVEAALAHPELLTATLARVAPEAAEATSAMRLQLRHLATGGAKRVYLVTVQTSSHEWSRFVLKQFLPVQLAHLPPGASIGGYRTPGEALDRQLLARMVWAARRIDADAPGLGPRFGGFWEWQDASGQRQRVMTEAYVDGDSLERWKALLEDRFTQGVLDFQQYSSERQTLERQAVAAYVRLWLVLECQTFTSDPSPWNVLFTPTPLGLQPTLIDLHSLHDGGTPLYVFQILEEQFGHRDEIRDHVLCPGIVDALGEAAAVRFLLAVDHDLAVQEALRRRHGLTSYAASRHSIRRFLTSRPPTGSGGDPHIGGR